MSCTVRLHALLGVRRRPREGSHRRTGATELTSLREAHRDPIAGSDKAPTTRPVRTWVLATHDLRHPVSCRGVVAPVACCSDDRSYGQDPASSAVTVSASLRRCPRHQCVPDCRAALPDTPELPRGSAKASSRHRTSESLKVPTERQVPNCRGKADLTTVSRQCRNCLRRELPGPPRPPAGTPAPPRWAATPSAGRPVPNLPAHSAARAAGYRVRRQVGTESPTDLTVQLGDVPLAASRGRPALRTPTNCRDTTGPFLSVLRKPAPVAAR
ncbi:hypothetical protein EDC02_5036 [Micromonospora sp. Llam0]|nr:hypothetical protein EDC02_5036 [Micromonospora sp. Llam0]